MAPNTAVQQLESVLHKLVEDQIGKTLPHCIMSMGENQIAYGRTFKLSWQPNPTMAGYLSPPMLQYKDGVCTAEFRHLQDRVTLTYIVDSDCVISQEEFLSRTERVLATQVSDKLKHNVNRPVVVRLNLPHGDPDKHIYDFILSHMTGK